MFRLYNERLSTEKLQLSWSVASVGGNESGGQIYASPLINAEPIINKNGFKLPLLQTWQVSGNGGILKRWTTRHSAADELGAWRRLRSGAREKLIQSYSV